MHINLTNKEGASWAVPMALLLLLEKKPFFKGFFFPLFRGGIEHFCRYFFFFIKLDNKLRCESMYCCMNKKKSIKHKR